MKQIFLRAFFNQKNYFNNNINFRWAHTPKLQTAYIQKKIKNQSKRDLGECTFLTLKRLKRHGKLIKVFKKVSSKSS